MISASSYNLSRAVSCQICSYSLDLQAEKLFQQEVVETSCNSPHYFHLKCISQKFDNKFPEDRRCHVCKEKPLPLVRLSGVRLYEASPYCESLAPHACRTGNLPQLQELLGQDPRMVNQHFSHPTLDSSTTLLSIAASFGQIECLKALINCGPGQFELDEALEYAADSGRVESVNFLLSKGATGIESALIHASMGGHAECVEALIDNGASDFSTALSRSTMKGRTECLEVLLRRVKTVNTDDLNICLEIAIYWERPETMQILIDNGANDLDNALYLSVVYGRCKCLDILLLNGANISVDALRSAIEKGHIECLKLLVDNGTNDLHGLLNYARRLNRIECKRILREKLNSQQISCTIL